MNQQWLWGAVLLSLSLVLLASCGGSDGSSGDDEAQSGETDRGATPDQPDEPVSQRHLAPGEVLMMDGALLGLHPEADVTDVEVDVQWLDASDDPTFAGDDERFTRGERFVQITATDIDDDWVTTSEPFFVGIPVPAEFDEAHLYPLQFMYGDLVVFHDEEHYHEAPDTWATRLGVYDPRYRLFFVPLASIGGPDYPTRIGMAEHVQPQPLEEADVVDTVLAEHFPGLELEPRSERQPQAAADVRPRGAVMHPLSHSPGHTAAFRVVCNLEQPPGLHIGGLECDSHDTAITAMQGALDDALPVYQELDGADRPALIRSFMSLFEPLTTVYLYHFMNEHAHEGCEGVRGFYRPSERLGVTCLEAVDQGLDRARLTTTHELFHAMQFSYGNMDWDGLTVEGTARMTEDINNLTELSGIENDLRVDNPITEERPYRGEYFFHHLLGTSGLDFSELGGLFSRGLEIGDLDAFIKDKTPFNDLGDAYWDWAKNQAFEQRGSLGHRIASGSCSYNWRAADSVRIDYDHIAPPDNAHFAIPALASEVVRLELYPLPEDDYTVDLNVATDSDDIRVKFYDKKHAGSTACRTDPDTDEYTAEVSPGGTTVVYALISNTSQTTTAVASFEFPDDGASMQILSPQSGTSIDEGEEIEFRAIASGLQGANPDTLSIDWGYENHQGTYIGLGNTANGESLTLNHLCDGSYTVIAEASSASSGMSVANTVTVNVRDLGATNPPPQCPVAADIIAPSDGSTFALGDTVSFEAVVDDSRADAHPDSDELRYTARWRVGGPDGLIVAQNTLAFSRSKFGPGEQDIHLEYGAAHDQITINIVDTESHPPEVNITSPGDGATFTHWDGDGGTMGMEVDFTGTGIDDQDGALSGNDLVWSRRDEGSSNWTEAGTGTSTTMYFGYSCQNWQGFEIRLVGENSDGLSDADTITIAIQSPPC